MSDLSKVGGPRRRRRAEKTAEQIERDKKLNRERVDRKSVV